MPGASNRRSRTPSPGSRLEHRARQSRRRSGACLASIALHGLALGLLLSIGGLEPALPALEVFTTEPEPDPAAQTPISRPLRTVESAKPRPARAARAIPPSNQPPAQKGSSEAAIRQVNAPARERASDERPRDEENAAREHVALASAPVAPVTLTPAKTLTDIEPPSEAELRRDDAPAAKTKQSSDGDAEMSAAPAQSSPLVAPRAVVSPPVDPPERGAQASEQPNMSVAQLSPAEAPTESPTTTTRDVTGAAPSGSPSAQAVTAPTTNERSAQSAAETVVRRASRSSGANAPIGVVITGPTDGYTLGASDPPLVVVQGEVDDPSVSEVSLITGTQRFSVPVTSGRFRHAVPVLEPTVRVRVETPPSDNRIRASASVTVHGMSTPTLAVLLYWPNHDAGPVDLAAAWRPRSDRVDDTVQRVSLAMAQDDTSLTMYYLRNPKSGVYTFVLTSIATDAQPVQPAVHVPGSIGGPKMLPAVSMDGIQRGLVARVLLPQGVLWEQDDWFSGQSANGNIVTKFRFPEGVSWSERAGGSR
jgi:hypothetical protein